MSRLSFLVLAMCAGLCASHAGAQSAGRVPVRGGEIQGLELGLEGALHAPRGGTLRWLLALYEVIGTSDLRLAPGAEVQLTTALDPSAAPVVARADEHGRIALEIAIPDDAPDTFPVVLRALSRGVIRRFELVVRVDDPRAIAVWVARQRVLEGAPVHTFGRLWDSTTGHPIARDEVRLTARDQAGRPVATPVRVRADESGLFAHVFRLRRDVVGAISITASAERDDRTVDASASTWIGEPEAPELILAVAPERSVVAPDENVPVDVVLRTAEGRPVPGAMVELSNIDHRDTSRRALTDARGRARFTWHVPRTGAPIRDLLLEASATREGLGSTSASAPVRVATVDHAASVSVEGGALIPSIGGRVWVRVVGLDGRPAGAGVPVQLRGARLGAAQRTTTDASGIARFDVRVAPASVDPSPRCGGEGQASASIEVGDGARAYSLESCLPLDGDGTARVRADVARVRSGTSVQLEVERASEVARAPVWISLLANGPSGPRAIGSHVLAPNETRAELPIPVDAVGTILVRARPIGPGGRELRGGSALVWSEPGAPIAIDAALDAAGVRIERRATSPQAEPEVPVSAWAIALPIDEARALAEQVGQSALGPLASLRIDDALASNALIEGALAAATPLDTAAPWVLRGNTPTAVPAPHDPTQAGLLRDPWRAQSRFLTGRLALVFSAIERHVAAAVPGRIDDVAVQTGVRWDFNAQILTAIGGSGDLGAEGATGLGGEPLTIEQLRRVDPTFTYDRVAGRITRERLYRLLVALRRFVQQNAFDLPWARVGDPSTWLRHLPSMYIPGVGQLPARELVDAWGRPFVLRRVTGRARFAAWAPLDGWELFSSGPDGRPGNGDDLADPTARVLPAGSAYAEAVGEDWLLARLRGVELGRATVDLLQQSGAISVSVGGVPEQPDAAAQHHSMQLWSALPAELRVTPEPLALRRPARPGEGAGGRVVSLRDGTTSIDLSHELDEEPREWGAFVAAFSHEGRAALAEARARLGSPLIVEARLPERLRVSEPAELSLFVTNASDVDRRVAIQVRAEGPLSGHAPELTLPAGTSQRASVVLEASDVGPARASIVLLESSEPLRTLSWRTTIDAGLHPTRTRAATALSGPEWRTRLEVPGDAARPIARVVLMHPSALHRDPDLADARERDPAIVAWAATLAGAPLDAELRARLLGMQEYDGSFRGTDPGVSTACALIALSAIAEDDPEAASAAERARGALTRMGGELITSSQQLAALAGSGAPDPADLEERDLDPVSAHASELRTALRRELRSVPDEPSLLARMSAALLLADPRDAYGRVMFERARPHLEEVRSGGGLRLRPTEARDTGSESLSATLALSIAAHQLGETELARRLAAGALDRDHVIARTAGEPLFWLLAAASYGVLGTGEPPSLTLEAAGRSRPIEFVAGVALVPLEGVRPGERIELSLRRTDAGPAIVARAELVLERPFRETAGDALELELNGDPGDVDGVAALELTVRARRALRAGVVVDVQLPAGVRVDDELERALQSAGAIRVEPREPGLLRIVLGPLESGVAVVLPLPLRWSVRGELRGLGVVAHPADLPEQMSILPPRVLSIAPARDLE